jgi:subtilisin-like proprotein convertase family protein
MLRLRTLLTAGVGALALAGVAFASSFSNTAAISVPDGGGGTVGSAPVSQITVSGEPTVNRLEVQVSGFSHAEPDDIDILLVGPNGTKVVLMSDAGSDNTVGGLDLIFDDQASQTLSDEGVLSSGIYPPSNYGPSAIAACGSEPATDIFPNAPAGAVSANLDAFQGSDPNGVWSLYVVDDCGGFMGSVDSGWMISVNPPPLAVGVSRFAASSRGAQVTLSWRTAVESTILGFNLFRSAGGSTERVNRSLIQAHRAGSPAGSAYRFVDTHVRRGVSYTYRLQLVHRDGSRRAAGAVALQTR